MATATANQPEASSTFPPSLTWSFSVSGTVTGTWTATLWSAPYYDGTYVQLPVVVGSTQVTGTTTTAGTTVTYGTPTTSYYYQVRVTGGGITGTVTSTPLYFYSPYQGPQGVQGSQGIKGDQGPTGITGPQGHQGLQGLMEIVDFSGQNQVLTSYTDTAHVKPNPTFTFDGTVLALTGNMNASGAFATSAGFTGPTVSTSGLIYSGGFTGPAANTINGIGIDPLSKNVSAVGTLNTSGTIATSAGFTGPTVSASGLIRSGGFTGPAANTINGIGIEPLTKNVSAVGTLNTSGTIATSAGFTGPTVSTSGLIYSGGFTGPAANTINGIGIEPLTKNVSAVGTLNTSGTIATSAGFTGPTVSTSGLIYSGGFTGPAANTINGIGIDPLTKNMSAVGTLNTSGTIATSAGFTGPTVSTSGLIYSGGFTGPAANTINGIGIDPLTKNMSSVGTLNTSGRITSGAGVSVGGTMTGVTTLNASGSIATSAGFTGPTVSTSGLISSGGGLAAGGAITGVSTLNASGTIATSAGFTGPTVSTSGLISSGGGLAAGGAITGVTTLAMSGALSGGTTISNSDNTRSSNFTTPTASSNNIGGVILNASAVTASSINNGSSTLTVSTPTGANTASLTVQVGSGTGNAITTPGTIQCGAITSGGALALGANGITSGTHVPAANNLYNLGSVSAGWSTVYGGTFSGNASGLTGSPNITVGTVASGRLTISEATGTPTVTTTGVPTAVLSPPGDAIMTGSLTLAHNNQPGQSSIVFASATNSNSDYGYITFMDDVSNLVSERNRLLIGVHNDVSEGSDAVVLMPFGGYVGIGQLFPAYTLDVTGNVRATTGFVGNLNGNVTGNISNSAAVRIYLGTTEYANFTTGGLNVTGINNNNGGITNAGNIVSCNTYIGSNIYGTFAYFQNSALNAGVGGNYAIMQDTVGSTFVNAASGRAISFRTSNNTVANITSTGLAINNADTAAAYALDVTGDVRATSSFIGYLNGTAAIANFLDTGTRFSTGNWYNTGEPTPYNRFYFAASGITYINGSGLEFYTAGTPRVVITSTGLGINTTSAAPAYPLDVTGTTRSSNFLSRFYVVNVPTGQIGGIAASNLIGSGAVAGIVRSFCYTTGSGGASNSEIVNASCYDLYVYRQGGAGIWAAQTITTTGGSPVPYWNTTNFTDPYPRYSVSYSNNTGTSQNFYITYQVLSSF
jgi:hypothetical protein